MSGLFTILLIVFGILLLLVFVSGFLRYIPNNKVGIVEKLVSGRGSVKSGFIALKGEAGFQPDVCAVAGICLSRFSTASIVCLW